MNSVLALIMLGGLTIAQLPVADASSQAAGSQSTLRSTSAPVDPSALSPAPTGKSTVRSKKSTPCVMSLCWRSLASGR
jgi:hypothetical protein